MSGKCRVLFGREPDEDAAVAAVVDGVVELEDEIAVLFACAQPKTAFLRVRAAVPAIAANQEAVSNRPFTATQLVRSRPLKSDFKCPSPVVEQAARAQGNKSVARGDFFIANVVTVRF